MPSRHFCAIILLAVDLGDDVLFSVIFDMDGTLLDTQSIYVPAWDYAGKAQGIDNLGRHTAVVCGMNDAGWTAYLNENFPSLDMGAFVKDVKKYVNDNLIIRYMPGAERLLKFLKQKGVKLALASGSGRQQVIDNLKQVGATDFFDVLVGGDEVENGKPAPDIFLLAAKRLGANTKDCYVLEDSPNGVKSAVAAGIKCIGIPDVAQFNDEIKSGLTAQFKTLNEAVDFFEGLF